MDKFSYGTLTIRIWVRWQDQMKAVTVFSKSCQHEKVQEMAGKFFDQNPCCLELDPEVKWTFDERIPATTLPRAYKAK